MNRKDRRGREELRPMTFKRHFTKHAHGSVLVSMGDTRVLCTAFTQQGVPPFLEGRRQGWVTAEYAMLPSSTRTRKIREVARGKIEGRTHEIQRLIGRSMRAVTDLTLLDGYTIWCDCDVIQADGGTRTAAINGVFLALQDAVAHLLKKEMISENPIRNEIAAVSVGVVRGDVMLDLDYQEDSSADVDMNVVMMADGRFVEVQGTGEEATFNRDELNALLDLAWKGVQEIIELRRQPLEE